MKPQNERSDQAEARRAMLDEIRRQLAASSSIAVGSQAGEGAGAITSADAARASGATPSTTTAQPPGSQDALVERFRQAVDGVAGQCTVVADVAAASRAVRAILDACGARRIVLSDAALVRQVIEGIEDRREVMVAASDPQPLFACDVGITTAQWAVAETGTLVLDSGAEHHRLASLIPPVHVALVAADRVRPTIGSVLGELASRGAGGLGHCVTFVTGPSRTSDIELTLAIGVHGPGELRVIVIEKAPDL